MQLVAVVPIGVLAAAFLYLHWRAQEHEREQLQLESARLLASAVDNALDSSIERLMILARLWGSAATDEPGLYAQSRAALESIQDWANIVAIRGDGTVVFTAAEPFGEKQPLTERPDVWRPIFAEAEPVIADVFRSAERGVTVSVGVPVIRNDRVAYALIADLNPDWYDELTARQKPPPDAVLAIMDRNYKFVARNIEGNDRRGSDPTPEFVADLRRQGEVLGRYVNLNGTAVYTAGTHTRHGWSVGFATPSAPVDDAFVIHLLSFGLLWFAALLLGLAYAFARARPIASSLKALEAEAAEIGRGRRGSGAPLSGVAEIDTAVAAFERSSELLQTAKRDRQRALETERQARADAEAANRAKDEFLALLGHELRNPMAAISNATAVLRDPARTEANLAFGLEVIERQGKHLRHLIDDLLDVGRVMTDKIVLQREPMNLATTVMQVVEGLQTAGTLAEREIETDVTPVHVDADPTRLEQVVTNLLGNAARYTEIGGRICVRLRAERGQAVLTISDDGIGIPPEDLPRVFEPFFQGGATKRLGEGGLGVGLTLVDKLVRLHGGSVAAESPGRGRGATFTIRLPLSTARREAGSSAAGGRTTIAEPITVLVVEDNPDARTTLRLALEMNGCKVLEAGDALTGLEIAERERPAVALLDIGLPGIDGYELARRLRSALQRRIMLIALTGYGSSSDEKKAMDAGFDRHLTKPVGIAALVQILVESARGRS